MASSFRYQYLVAAPTSWVGLEVILSDFERLEADTKAAETTNQKEFEKFTTDSAQDKAVKVGSRSVIQSISPVSQSAQAISQPNQSVNQPITQPAQSTSQPNQSASQSVSQSISQSVS